MSSWSYILVVALIIIIIIIINKIIGVSKEIEEMKAMIKRLENEK